MNPFWLFIPPPNARVQRIPITPRILLESVHLGRWSIEYPPHSIPKVRWDVHALWIVLGAVGIGALALWLYVRLFR